MLHAGCRRLEEESRRPVARQSVTGNPSAGPERGRDPVPPPRTWLFRPVQIHGDLGKRTTARCREPNKLP